MHDNALHILRIEATASKSGLSVPTIRRKLREGTFPKPIKLGKRAVGWRSDVIDEWLKSRPEADYAPFPNSANSS